jgi:hypothetical protein
MLARADDLGGGAALPSGGGFEPPPWPKIQGGGCASCSLAARGGALASGVLAAMAIAALAARRRGRR